MFGFTPKIEKLFLKIEIKCVAYSSQATKTSTSQALQFFTFFFITVTFLSLSQI